MLSERLLLKISISCLTFERRIPQSPIQEMVADQGVGPLTPVVSSTGPFLPPHTSADISICRHLFNESHATKQVAFRFDDRGSEAPLPQAANMTVPAVESCAVPPANRLHHATEALCPRGRHQHADFGIKQPIGMDRHTMCRCRLFQQIEEQLPIVGIPKYSLVVVPLLKQQVRPPRYAQARESGHSSVEEATTGQPLVLTQGEAIGHAGDVVGDLAKARRFFP